MPAPGDQYHGGNIKNPFEERVMNAFTATEIATLQSRLNKQLGPEYISQRPGNGGGRVAYLEGNKAIALANEVFGFNGWSSSLGQVQIDYVDELQNGKVSLGLSIVVRITLKDGTYHEDIGYGSIENGKGKAASFEKAKKEAATDGLKRALRTFGNVLGNCLYDKEYLKKVQAMKVKPIKFEEDSLYRHANFAPPEALKQEPDRTPARPNQVLRTRTEHLGESFSADFDDEFDGNLFDGVDITENNRDEFSFDASSVSDATATKRIEPQRSNGVQSGRASPTRNAPPPRQGAPRPQTNGAPNGHIPAQQQPQQQQPQQQPNRPPQSAPNVRQPQTPQQNNHSRSDPAHRMPPPNGENGSGPRSNGQHSNNPPRPQPQAQQTVNHQRPAPPPAANTTSGANPQAPVNKPPVGFTTSRNATMFQNSDAPPSLNSIPAFNPNVESPIPKEQRTPGIDHARSVPIKRDTVGAPSASQNTTNAARPAPGAAAPGGAGSFNRPSNFVNSHQDAHRRIGMPNGPGYGMSPSANRGAYKPPSLKRPALQDVSNTGAANPNGNGAQQGVGEAGDGPDAKKPRIEAPGTENVAVPVPTT